MEHLPMALNLFLAGFIIVFAVLIMLILIIMLYGKIIQSVTNASEKKKEQKNAADAASKNSDSETASVTVAEQTEAEDDEIPGEVIAAIAAAVDAMYGDKTHKIKSVKRTKSSRPAWAYAGLRDNTRPF